MPWMETCAVEQRNEFVHNVLTGVACKTELCRRYGISRPTGNKWLQRFEELGVSGLADRSSAPRCHPNRVPAVLVEMILSARRDHSTWGARKLRAWLQRHYERIRWPAASTIGELLRDHDLTHGRKRRHRTPAYTQPFSGYDHPNAVWCADFKGWFTTGDGRCCHPLTITDGFSRYLLRCQALESQHGRLARAVFESAFREHGLPAAIRTDNGTPFASRGIGGLSRLSIWWIRLGIIPERIEPGKPQQNGRHERMHLTLKQETTQPAEATFRRQQKRFDAFQFEYNVDRPHEALGQRPPAEFYGYSARRYPRRLPELEYPETMKVRSVQSTGVIKWHRNQIYVGSVLGGQRVGIAPLTDGVWLIHLGSLAIGVLDDRRRKVWDLEHAARRGLIGRDVLQSPFRYASGALQDENM